MHTNTYETLYLEVDEPVARLVLDRPEKLNAISGQMRRDRDAALDDLEDSLAYDSDEQLDVKVLLVEAEGRAFCAGADLQEATERFARGHDSIGVHEDLDLVRSEAEGWHRLWEIAPVTVAKVQGYCLAAGLMPALNCDLVVAAEDAPFGMPQIKSIGFNPDLGLWPYTIGLRKTKELLFTGSIIRGREAAELGMINRAVPEEDLDHAVDELVAEIVAVDRDLLYYAKRMVNDVSEHMGMGSMLGTGIAYDGFSHLSEARQRFKEIADEEGLEAAIEQEFPDASQDIKESEE